MSVNIDSLQYVSENEIPKKMKRGKWRKIFESIPKGQALVLRNIKRSNVSNPLSNLQKKNLFINYFVVSRKDKVYVVNPEGSPK